MILNSFDNVELAVSLNSNEAQILRKQGHEWKATEVLTEVRVQKGLYL